MSTATQTSRTERSEAGRGAGDSRDLRRQLDELDSLLDRMLKLPLPSRLEEPPAPRLHTPPAEDAPPAAADPEEKSMPKTEPYLDLNAAPAAPPAPPVPPRVQLHRVFVASPMDQPLGKPFVASASVRQTPRKPVPKPPAPAPAPVAAPPRAHGSRRMESVALLAAEAVKAAAKAAAPTPAPAAIIPQAGSVPAPPVTPPPPVVPAPLPSVAAIPSIAVVELPPEPRRSWLFRSFAAFDDRAVRVAPWTDLPWLRQALGFLGLVLAAAAVALAAGSWLGQHWQR